MMDDEEEEELWEVKRQVSSKQSYPRALSLFPSQRGNDRICFP